ncbi:MAG: YceD family protein [Chloroherpetonaceae bacterium]
MRHEQEGKRIAHIKISSLKNGVHRYEFECVSSDFADDMIDSERFAAPISISATLTKAATELVVELSVTTVISLQCDRCLAPITKTISGDYRILFLQSANAMPDLDDDVRWLSKHETHIDLTTDVRETLLLAVPMKNVCEAPSCIANDAPITRKFSQAHDAGFRSDWQQQLAEISKKFKN